MPKLAFFAVVAIPPEVIGCRHRGLAAVSLALLGGLLGIGTAVAGVVQRLRGNSSSEWWIATALVLGLPAAYIVLLEA
jgi:hypothetical protein